MAAAEAGIAMEDVDCLLAIYESLDQDGNGTVEIEELISFLRKSNTGLHSDEDSQRMEDWFKASNLSGPITSLEFFQLYGRAPDYIEEAFGCQMKSALGTEERQEQLDEKRER